MSNESPKIKAVDGFNLPADRSLFSMLEPTIERDAFGKLKMRSFTSNSELRYTLDGSDVTVKSKTYHNKLIWLLWSHPLKPHQKLFVNVASKTLKMYS